MNILDSRFLIGYRGHIKTGQPPTSHNTINRARVWMRKLGLMRVIFIEHTAQNFGRSFSFENKDQCMFTNEVLNNVCIPHFREPSHQVSYSEEGAEEDF